MTAVLLAAALAVQQPGLRDADSVVRLLASLRAADLRGASFRSADLSGADLTGADLTGADLTGAHLTGVDVQHLGGSARCSRPAA